MCFTMDTLKTDEEVAVYESRMSTPPDHYEKAEFSSVGRLWVWYGFVFVMVLSILIVNYTIDSVDEETLLQIERKRFITSKVIDHEPDDNYDDDDDELLVSLTSENDEEDDDEGGGCCSSLVSSSAGFSLKVGKKKLPPVKILGVPHSLDDIKAPLILKED